MEEQIKNIIAPYIKVSADQISATTIIDRTAVGSSIILHRMYAQLANEGIAVASYMDIKNFGTLLQQLNGNAAIANTAVQPLALAPAVSIAADDSSIGIDIEQVSQMPTSADFREDEFYTMNFSATEIAYCILQANPAQSFAGLFAAKEAIVKADNRYTKQPFNSIIIDHLPTGQPVHHQFHLSISHTPQYAVAAAIPKKNTQPVSQIQQPPVSNSNSFPQLIALLALLLSIAAICIALLRH
jgi:phosphopantetheinyl transferase (holo-ACP synthase)